MTWPIDTIVRTVSGTFTSSTLVPKTGTVSFTPTNVVTVTSNGASVLPKTPIIVTLDVTGSFSISLPVTDNALLTPTVWAYDVRINLFGSKPTVARILLPFADGTVVDLPAQLRVNPTAMTTQSNIDAARGAMGPVGNPGLVPVFSRQNSLSLATGGTRFYFETARTIASARASVGTPSTGSPIIVGVRINGSTIGTISIDAGTNTKVGFLNVAVQAGDYATIDILSVGSTTSGSDLSVILSID